MQPRRSRWTIVLNPSPGRVTTTMCHPFRSNWSIVGIWAAIFWKTWNRTMKQGATTVWIFQVVWKMHNESVRSHQWIQHRFFKFGGPRRNLGRFSFFLKKSLTILMVKNSIGGACLKIANLFRRVSRTLDFHCDWLTGLEIVFTSLLVAGLALIFIKPQGLQLNLPKFWPPTKKRKKTPQSVKSAGCFLNPNVWSNMSGRLRSGGSFEELNLTDGSYTPVCTIPNVDLRLGNCKWL